MKSGALCVHFDSSAGSTSCQAVGRLVMILEKVISWLESLRQGMWDIKKLISFTFAWKENTFKSKYKYGILFALFDIF